ncbi:hypothetical protein ACFLMW_003816 [Salmonella enterica]
MIELLHQIKGAMAFYQNGAPEDKDTFWQMMEQYVEEAMEKAKTPQKQD